MLERLFAADERVTVKPKVLHTALANSIWKGQVAGTCNGCEFFTRKRLHTWLGGAKRNLAHRAREAASRPAPRRATRRASA